ncbi:MAG: cytochrome c biogenesis protein ResB [Marmoricola sp.]
MTTTQGSSFVRAPQGGGSGPGGTPPALGPVAFARWMWRQLTSMRTALLLLFLLALAAIPGSIFPQESVDSQLSAQWQRQHPDLTPIFQKLGLFNVFHSAWFSAIYLLLAVSLVGCILPRCRVYLKSLRVQPPSAPADLTRLPEHRELELDDGQQEQALQRAEASLRRRHFRIRHHGDSISADKGRLREAGNLLFHVSVLLVLAGVAIGSLFGYEGGVIVVTGKGFSNSLSQYDDFRPGGFFTPSRLAPFSLKVDNFDVSFIRRGREAGMAHKFAAGLTYRPEPTAAPRHTRIAVNHPLHIDGTNVYLISHGYAPKVTVRDGRGNVAYSGPVVFLPEDKSFRSFGVIKVPDAVTASGKPDQLGFEGEFYPTYAFTDATGPFSAFPDDKNPALSMLAYHGNLGLDDGVPQNVYTLEKKHLTPLMKGGRPMRVDLMRGHKVVLPHGRGSIELTGVDRFVKLQVNRTPCTWLALLGMVLALIGLVGSLFLKPRRVWVRARRKGGRTLVEVAGLVRAAGTDLGAELDRLTAELRPDTQQKKEGS